MLLLIQYTLIFASVLILVALGGCFSEHSGVINIGLEGIMVMGALGGALMMKYLPESAPAAVVILLVVLASVLVGMVFSLLLHRRRQRVEIRERSCRFWLPCTCGYDLRTVETGEHRTGSPSVRSVPCPVQRIHRL